jgi:predicted nucleic acid-binding protein
MQADFAYGAGMRQYERVLRKFLENPGIDVLYPGDGTTRVYAGLYRQLRRQGTPIPINDLWIASLAVEHNLALFTRDRHFHHLPQLEIVGGQPS